MNRQRGAFTCIHGIALADECRDCPHVTDFDGNAHPSPCEWCGGEGTELDGTDEPCRACSGSGRRRIAA